MGHDKVAFGYDMDDGFCHVRKSGPHRGDPGQFPGLREEDRDEQDRQQQQREEALRDDEDSIKYIVALELLRLEWHS